MACDADLDLPDYDFDTWKRTEQANNTGGERYTLILNSLYSKRIKGIG